MWWVLMWLIGMIAAVISGITAVILFGVALEKGSPRYLIWMVPFIFLSGFAGWASWAASFMS
jgi:energy-converting hydrogenase Eha subunit A